MGNSIVDDILTPRRFYFVDCSSRELQHIILYVHDALFYVHCVARRDTDVWSTERIVEAVRARMTMISYGHRRSRDFIAANFRTN